MSHAGLPVQMLISYLHAWGIPNNDIILEPLLRPHNQHYSGVLFQLHLLDQQDSGGTSLMAVGTTAAAGPHSQRWATHNASLSWFKKLSIAADAPWLA